MSLIAILMKALLAMAAVVLIGVGIWIAKAQTVAPATETKRADDAAPASAAVSAPNFTVGAGNGNTAPAAQWKTGGDPNVKAALAGRVLDHDGKPIAGAVVQLNPTGTSTKTDAQGNYEFKVVKNSGDYTVGVTADGFVSIDPYRGRDPSLQLSKDSQARRDIVMERGVSLAVTVTDGVGQPIPKADIDVGIRQDYQFVGPRRVQTDQAGYVHFVLPVSKLPYVLSAAIAKYAPAHAMITAESPDKPLEVNLILDAGVTVRGMAICSDGKPAAGWQIDAKPQWWASNYYPEIFPIGKDGSFTLKDIGSGPYVLSIHKQNISFEVTSMTMPPSTQPIHVEVPGPSPGSLIKVVGLVRFIGGRPQSGRMQIVRAVSNDPANRSESYDSSIEMFYGSKPKDWKLPTNEFQYTFEQIPPGSYTLNFESDEIEFKSINVKVPGALPVVELKIVKKPRLSGTVQDAETGQAITHFAVRARKLETLGNGPNYVQDPGWAQVSNAAGHYDLELVGPGVYQVQASVDGYAWLWSDKIRVEKGGEKVAVDLKLTHGGSLRGIVVGPDGNPVAGAKVIPLSMAKSVSMGYGDERFESEAGAVTTGPDGGFVLVHLAAGEEAMKVTHADFAPLIVRKQKVIEQQVVDAGRMSLHVGGNVEGVIYDGSGKPEAGVMLQFQDASGYGGGGDEEAGRLGVVSSDENGHFHIEHLAQQILYVNLADRWSRQGVSRRTIRPVDGKTAVLDFGGTNPVKGRLMAKGKPVANRRMWLTVGERYFGKVMALTSTDGAGRFTFLGPPPGHYTLACETEGERGEPSPLKMVDLADQPMDLGDVVYDVGDVLIKIVADDPADLRKVNFVPIESDWAVGPWQEQLARAARTDLPELWRAKSIPTGSFRVKTYQGEGDRLVFSTPFERKSGVAETKVTLRLPRASAKLTVHLADRGKLRPSAVDFLLLRNEEAGTEFGIFPDAPALDVPPGTYRVISEVMGQAMPGGGKEDQPIVVTQGQNREVTINRPISERVGICVCVWSETGVLMSGVHPKMTDADGHIIEPGGGTGLGMAFAVSRSGKYRVTIDRPAGGSFVQDIEMPSETDDGNRAIWLPVNVLMR